MKYTVLIIRYNRKIEFVLDKIEILFGRYLNALVEYDIYNTVAIGIF